MLTDTVIPQSSLTTIPPSLESTLYPLLIGQVFAITAAFSLIEFVRAFTLITFLACA